MKTKKKSRAAVARKPKLEPWRAELARIVRFLNNLQSNKQGTEKYDSARKLWAVMSALRGPDFAENFSNPIKHAITGVLRRQAGLLPLALAYVNTEDCGEYVDLRNKHKHDDGHYYAHAREAFNALGLEWNEVNK